MRRAAVRRLSPAWIRGAAVALAFLAGAAAATAQQVVSAEFERPVSRYGHNVLGDEGEYDTLAVTLSDGRQMRFRIPAPLVFEDLAPRLWDMDRDGAPEVVTVESDARLGARLTFWRVTPDGFARLAATPHIGTRFRWLAPIGAADLDGDGSIEFAYVDRPHLARVLRIWRYETDAAGGVTLTEIASAPELTNHRIGEDFITGGLRDCGQGPEVLTANADWTRIMASRLRDDRIETRELGPFSPAAMEAALACK